jgi:hypothetical protein
MTVRAITTAHIPDDQIIREGDLYEDDHPFVAAYPQFFADISSDVQRPVERATAAPDEKRVTRPRKKAADE